MRIYYSHMTTVNQSRCFIINKADPQWPPKHPVIHTLHWQPRMGFIPFFGGIWTLKVIKYDG